MSTHSSHFKLSSSALLVMHGLILMGLGLYFIFIRPPLLPEDQRFMGSSLTQIQTALPGLVMWLTRVFWVMGGYMFAAGLLTCQFALTTFHARAPGAVWIAGISGMSSIGTMMIVNFLIGSDFKWIILLLALPWILAMALFHLEKSVQTERQG